MNYIPTEDTGGDTDAAQKEYNEVETFVSDNKNKKMHEQTEQNASNTNRLIAVAILAFLIGFGVGFLVFANREAKVDVPTDDIEITDDTTNVDSETESAEEVVEQVTVTGSSVAVSEQNFGLEVALDSVVLDRTSWVVVFEDLNGQPGNILGAQLYDVGEISNGAVTLTRGTVPDSLYYVKLHGDDGDRQFDFTVDVPYLGADGKDLTTTFMTITGTPR